jgi:hypothetical protein
LGNRGLKFLAIFISRFACESDLIAASTGPAQTVGRPAGGLPVGLPIRQTMTAAEKLPIPPIFNPISGAGF